VSTEGTAGASSFPVGTLQHVGKYTFHAMEDRWEWSDEMYRIHGFEPGEVVPTTELVLSHQEPAETGVGLDLVAEAVLSGRPHSLWHRIVDATGRTRSVVTVWEGLPDDAGDVCEVRGYMMDVTSGVRRDTSSAVSAAFEHRSVIDQAKGMLMLVHGVSADTAFGLLQKAACVTNTKLYVVAERLVEALGGGSRGTGGENLGKVARQVLSNGHGPPA
jgi:hypothetical protein